MKKALRANLRFSETPCFLFCSLLTTIAQVNESRSYSERRISVTDREVLSVSGINKRSLGGRLQPPKQKLSLMLFRWIFRTGMVVVGRLYEFSIRIHIGHTVFHVTALTGKIEPELG